MRTHRFSRMVAFSLLYAVTIVVMIVVLFHSYVDWNDFFGQGYSAIIRLLSFIGLVVALSCMIAGGYMLLVKQSERMILQKLEWLALGNYQQLLFEQPAWYEAYLPIRTQEINQELLRLRDKLVEVSNEMQKLSSVPHYVGNETKEEILEQERHRLARELHDSVSQQLFAAMMMLSAMGEQKENLPDSLQKLLSTVEHIINEAQSEMRALLLHLRPISLEGKSLKKGIESLLRELMTKIKLTITWELDDVHTSSGIEDHLFRIMQELLSNTLRHAKAEHLEVYLKQSTDSLLLRVIDDGVGFDMNQEKVGSYGLMNIRERVAGMGGTVKIVSFPSQGTIVEIKIPMV